MSFIEDTTPYTSRQLNYYSPAEMPRFGVIFVNLSGTFVIKQDLGIILLYHKCPRQIHKNHRPLLGILLLRVSILNLKVCYHDKLFCRDENFLTFDSILTVYYSFASFIPTFIQNISLLLVIICFIALKSSYKRRGDVLF